MYAGPEPLTPVRALIWDSMITLHTPTADISANALFRSSSVHVLPTHKPLAAAPTRQGVFGITRTMAGGDAFFAVHTLSIVSNVTPAATLTKTLGFSSSESHPRETSSSTDLMYGGFTAKNTTSDDLVTATASAATTPPRCVNASRRSTFDLLHIVKSLNLTMFAETNPHARASAMFPYPMKPTRILFAFVRSRRGVH